MYIKMVSVLPEGLDHSCNIIVIFQSQGTLQLHTVELSQLIKDCFLRDFSKRCKSPLLTQKNYKNTFYSPMLS